MARDSFDEMIEETTRQAKEFILEQPELKNIVTVGKTKNLSIKQLAGLLKSESTQYAKTHNGNFGELFQEELDAVDWRGLVAEF